MNLGRPDGVNSGLTTVGSPSERDSGVKFWESGAELYIRGWARACLGLVEEGCWSEPVNQLRFYVFRRARTEPPSAVLPY